MIHQAKSILKTTFGYDEFRLQQEAAITQVLNKKDALVIMPTGGGKSLCYQIPAMIFEGMTIVVSPLISLMKDQVEQLREYDIPAVYLNSSLRPEEYEYNVKRVLSGGIKLLYLAPETLMMDKTREMLNGLRIDCFTIDEAHCISEWGHDFRPEYRQLARIRKDFPEAVCIALTATATPRVQEDIKRSLNLTDSEAFISSFDRQNLFLKIADKKDPENQLLDFLYTRKNQSGIIYCFSRRQVDDLTYLLEQEGYDVKPYHAGLSARDRSINQRAFIRDDARIIVATIAFGMGINKPNVRYVVHFDMPQNIESYYQQIGRAGRDGLRSDCILLFGYADTQKIKYFINQKQGNEKEVAEGHLNDLIKFLEATTCRRQPLLSYFGEEYVKEECGMCDNCLSVDDDVEDMTIQAQKFMSCMIRSGEQFGAGHVIDVLRGSKAQKVLEHEHDQLPTYGIGNEWSKDQWTQLSRMLIRQNYISKGEYGSLQVEERGHSVLRGDENVFGILDRTSTAIDGETVIRTSSDVENNYNEELFELLRIKRKELADADDVPPYAIFPDTTLIEMSYYYPQNKDALEALYGVGSVKKEKFGDAFIGVIKTFTAEHDIMERQKTLLKKVRKTVSTQKHEQVGEAFNEGQSIKLLAEEHGVKEVTILTHLKKYLDEDNILRLDGLLEACNLSDRQRDQIIKAMDKKGPLMLRPVYEELNKQIGYDQLRIMQLYYLANASK
ncbi:MAG: DNA helicase RecQ [Balneola sp.]|nr:MAG: DNA helicase RecQ [Balneola sp.]